MRVSHTGGMARGISLLPMPCFPEHALNCSLAQTHSRHTNTSTHCRQAPCTLSISLTLTHRHARTCDQLGAEQRQVARIGIDRDRATIRPNRTHRPLHNTLRHSHALSSTTACTHLHEGLHRCLPIQRYYALALQQRSLSGVRRRRRGAAGLQVRLDVCEAVEEEPGAHGMREEVNIPEARFAKGLDEATEVDARLQCRSSSRDSRFDYG